MFRLSFLLLLIPFISSAQQSPKRTIMIYTHGDRTLVTLIEKSLGRLRVNDSLRFEHVTNLNEIYNTAMSDTTIRMLIDYTRFTNFKLSREQQKKLADMVTILSQYELFLSVNVNKVNALLEYQFYLYNADIFGNNEKLREDSASFWTTKDLLKPRYLNSFLIDVSSPDYSERIDREIAKMFPEAEKFPVAIISSGSQEAQETYLGLKDTLRLGGSVLSHDAEVPARKLHYSWYRQILSPDPPGQKILVGENPFLEFPANELSDNRFFLKVFDGVHSAIDSVDIHIKAKPEIYLVDTVISTYYYKSLFKSRDSINEYAHILSSTLSRSDVSKLKLTTWDRRIDTFHVKKEYYNGKRYKRRSRFKDWADLSMEEALVPTEDVINFQVETVNDGYHIHFDNEPYDDFYVNYFIQEEDLNVSSNTVNLTVEHRAYPMYSFIVSYNHLAYTALNKSISDTADMVSHEARFGLAVNLYSSNRRRLALEVAATAGASINQNRRVMVYSPFQAHLYLKKWAKDNYGSFIIGPSITSISVRSLVPLNRFEHTEWKPGISLGGEVQPLRWVSIMITGNGNFSPVRAYGYRVSSLWLNFRLKFYVPQ